MGLQHYSAYQPPWWLKNGLVMTLYMALWQGRHWQQTVKLPDPLYQPVQFHGANDVPIYGWIAIPDNPQATLVGTYGITGNLTDQWFLQILGRKAFAQGYAIALFDWRAHGQTAQLSPTLTSDGLYEGEDFIHIAAQAKARGCPAPFWLTGYSLGGQLALWGVKAAQELNCAKLGLDGAEIAGAAVICPSLDSNRSLEYLINHPLGRYLERAIARSLKRLAWELHQTHPGVFDPTVIEQINSIRGFDAELVIQQLGFDSVEAYYQASSALPLLPHLKKPTLILYAADDPLFDPTLISELQAACATNSCLDLGLTQYGGHVGYLSCATTQKYFCDPDPWWAWNRVLEWFQQIQLK